MALKGLVAYITGSTGGIGLAISRKLASEGCSLFIVGRSTEKLDALSAELTSSFSVEVQTCSFDLTDKDALKKSTEDCIARFGTVNIVINNAGVGALTSSPIELWDTVIDVNLKAAMRISKYFLPALETQAQKKRTAIIVNISSVSGLNKYGNLAPYCASKHGLVGFSGSLFFAIHNKGVRVTCINPGWVDTPMIHDLPSFDEEKCIKPEQVAHTVLFAVTFPGNACPTDITIWPQFE